MSTARREFTDEFKREAVALWETSGRLQTEVAAEFGIQPSQLRRWQRRLRGQALRPSPTSSRPTTTPAMPLPADQASEIARLQREFDRTRLERDILKKALGICAEVPR
jgi:transposase